MKKWLVVIFLVSAASALEASGKGPEIELVKLEPGVSDFDAYVLVTSAPRRSSSSSQGSPSSSSSAATVIGEAQPLNPPLLRLIAAARALVPATHTYETVTIPYIVWQRHRACEKEPYQYYEIIKEPANFTFELSATHPTNAFDFRMSLVERIKELCGTCVEVESISFGSPQNSAIQHADNIMRPSDIVRATEVGTRAARIAPCCQGHTLGITLTPGSVIRICRERGPLHIILRAENKRAESRIDTLLRAIAFTSIDFLGD